MAKSFPDKSSQENQLPADHSFKICLKFLREKQKNNYCLQKIKRKEERKRKETHSSYTRERKKRVKSYNRELGHEDEQNERECPVMQLTGRALAQYVRSRV